MIGAVFGALADQTNTVKTARPKTSPVKTSFVENAKLNSVELKQVLSLANQSGIQDATEVETFNYLPGGGRGISVKSKERVDGRNISYDTILVEKGGWRDGVPDKTAKHLGDFYIQYPKSTTLLRTYEIYKHTVRIVMDEGIPATLADQVMSAIVSKRVRFEDDGARRSFSTLEKIIPEAIYKSESNKGQYEIRLSEPAMHILMFNLDKGEVVITGVATYVI
jgi:hypothetical protein